MTLCPIALAVGCKKCALVKICPAKEIIGDYKKEEPGSKKGQRDTSLSKLALSELFGLKTGAPVVIKTVKSGKCDRYVADVFVDGSSLNQELLDKHLAVRVSE